jgi:DNA-nicking Smr family endonuclease
MGKWGRLKSQYKGRTPKTKVNYIDLEDTFDAEAELDYHNRGSLSQFEIEQIFENFINETHSMGLDRVLIITGKGQIVKPKVANLLKQSSKVREYRQAGFSNGQDGAFEVTLKE